MYGLVDDVADQINKLRDEGVGTFYFNILDGSDWEMVDALTTFLKERF